MFQNTKPLRNPCFRGFWVHSLKTSDKVLRYGENNQVEFSEHPTVVQGGDSPTVQAEISQAMEALFGLEPHKIKVLKRVE